MKLAEIENNSTIVNGKLMKCVIFQSIITGKKSMAMLSRKKPRNNMNSALLIELIGKTNARTELEYVLRIPKVIKQLRERKLSKMDLKRLGKVYGDLWPLIIGEASRKKNRNMNEIIAILLNAPKLRVNKPNSYLLKKRYENDIESNTINLRKYFLKRRKPMSARLQELRLKTNLTPAERLLKVVALLVRESIINNVAILKKKNNFRSNKQRRMKHRLHKQNKMKSLRELAKRNNDSNAANKINEKTVLTPKIHSMRNKRSLSLLNMNDENDLYSKALQSLIQSQSDVNEESDSQENIDYSDDGDDGHKKQQNRTEKNQIKHEQYQQHQHQEEFLREKEQNEQFNSIKTEKYRDYAFDTTDTDQFNEDDDLLRKYYGRQTRQAAYEDYDSFSDLMHLTVGHDSQHINRLHYGYMNDSPNNDEYDYNSMDYNMDISN